MVSDCASVERWVHRDLKKCRQTKNKEFFRISARAALEAIHRRCTDESFDFDPLWGEPSLIQSFVDDAEQRKAQDSQAATKDLFEQQEQARQQLEQEKAAQRLKQEEQAAQARRQLEQQWAAARVSQERRAAEERKQAKQRQWVDISTQEVLKRWPIGSGTIILCILSSVIFNKAPDVMWSVIIGIGLWGLWANYSDKQNALNLRKHWGLPAVADRSTVPSAPVVSSPPQAAPSAPDRAVKGSVEILSATALFGFVLVVLWPDTEKPSPTVQPSQAVVPTPQSQPAAQQYTEDQPLKSYAQVAERLNTKVPYMVDQITQLDRVIAGPGKKQLNYFFSFPNILDKDIESYQWRTEMRQRLVQTVCRDKGIKPALRDGGTFVYVYTGSKRTALVRIEIDRRDCVW